MASAATADENKEIARRFIDEVFNEQNYGLLDELCAEDCVYHGAPGEGDMRGIEEIRGYYEMLHAAFPDLEATREGWLSEGDMLASRYTYRGTHDGEFMGIEPTGKRVTITGMTFNRIEDGKMVETWVEADRLALMQQVGAIPSPERR